MAFRRTIDNLIALTIPEVQKIFLEAIRDIVDAVVLQEVIDAIERNDVEAAFKAIGFTAAALSPVLDAIERAFKESGVVVEEGFPPRIKLPGGGSTLFRFDARNPRAEKILREQSSNLVTRLTDEAKENVRISLERGMLAGNNPRKTALDIVGKIDPVTKSRVGGIIGLTNQQEYWVVSAKRKLENLDKSYFDFKLRDRRFDSVVQKAIDSGKSLSVSVVDKLLTSYKNRALKYRADTLGRTETIQSINKGEFQAYKQAIEEGTVEQSAVTKFWDDVGDDRERFTHRGLHAKYKKNGIDLDEPFVSFSGARMMHPGDTSLGAPAAEIVNCRCRVRYRVDFFAGLE